MFYIPDKNIPIFIPFGYANIGKTMMIQRLLRYLRSIGYRAQPEFAFRNDPMYPQICDMYMEEACGHMVAAATRADGTILLKIIDNRTLMPICYVLDIAGEYQWNIYMPHGGITPEMDHFVQSPNPKIWGFLIENNNLHEPIQRVVYVDQINHYAFHLNRNNSKNKVIFIYNKVDESTFAIKTSFFGRITTDWRELYDNTNSLYPGVFESFRETNAFRKFFKGKYRFRLQPFQSICVFENSNNVTFADGNDKYPQLLWNNLQELIREK